MWIEYTYKTPYGIAGPKIFESSEQDENEAIKDLERRLNYFGDLVYTEIKDAPPREYCARKIAENLKLIEDAQRAIQRYQDYLNGIQE